VVVVVLAATVGTVAIVAVGMLTVSALVIAVIGCCCVDHYW
jgi:hypothetical protein